MAYTTDAYQSINVEHYKATLSELKKQLKNKQKAINENQQNLNSSCQGFEAIKKIDQSLTAIANESSKTGSLPKAIALIGNILDGLEIVEKYQKEYKKNQDLQKEYRQAQITTQSLREEDSSVTDKIAIEIAKSAEKNAYKKYTKSCSDLSSLKSSADGYFNKRS